MNIISRLNSIRGLPTLPEIALKVQQIVFSDEGDADKLSRLVQQDPSLTAKIMSMANSGFYGSFNRIVNVNTAITRLGFNEIGHIVMATSVIKEFTRGFHRLDYRQFWKHALTAAHMAYFTTRAGAPQFSAEERAGLYLSGLMHDIGILIYDQFFTDEFDEILKYAAKNEVSFLEAEREVAPKDTHAAVGAALLEIWKLSPATTGGVRFHHAPERASDKQKTIPFAIYLSEYILCNVGLGSFEGAVVPPAGSLFETLKLVDDGMAVCLQEAEREVEKSELILAMGGGGGGPSAQEPGLLRTV